VSNQYVKSTHEYFPDYCDQVVRGITSLGAPFEVKTPHIVNNPLNWVNTLTGDYNPGWRDQVKKGIDATTHYVASKQELLAERCKVSLVTSDVNGLPGNFREYAWDGYPHYGSSPSVSLPTAAVLSNARNLALRKFLQRINEARTSLEGGQAIGEWKETVHAITNPLGALKDFTVNHVLRAKKRLRRIKVGGKELQDIQRYRNRPPRSAALAHAIAGTYLEFVFGWIPLANDVKAAVAGLLDRYDQPDHKTVSAKAIVSYAESAGDSTLFTDEFYSAVQYRVNVSSVNYRFKGNIQTGAVNGIRSVNASLGLLPEGFIPTVWELIPYSFVVDYFTNIGDIISSFAFQRSLINWGCRTVKIRTETKFGPVHFRRLPFPGDYYPAVRRLLKAEARGGGANFSASTVERTKLSEDNLFPDWEFHLPVVYKPWLNMSALLTQQFCSLF